MAAALTFFVVWLGVAVVPGWVIMALSMKECGYPPIAVLPLPVTAVATLAGGFLLLGRARPTVAFVSAFFLPLLVPALAYILGENCSSSWGRW